MLPIRRNDLKWFAMAVFVIAVVDLVAYKIYGFIGITLAFIVLLPVLYLVLLKLVRRYVKDFARSWRENHPGMSDDRMPDWHDGLAAWLKLL